MPNLLLLGLDLLGQLSHASALLSPFDKMGLRGIFMLKNSKELEGKSYIMVRIPAPEFV